MGEKLRQAKAPVMPYVTGSIYRIIKIQIIHAYASPFDQYSSIFLSSRWGRNYWGALLAQFFKINSSLGNEAAA